MRDQSYYDTSKLGVVGLDPATLATLSPLLKSLADSHSPRILLALRPQDPIPEWITHIVYLGPNSQVQAQGEKNFVLSEISDTIVSRLDSVFHRHRMHSAPSAPTRTPPDQSAPFYKGQILPRPDKLGFHVIQRESLVEMKGVRVAYGPKIVLGGWKEIVEGKEQDGLWWTVRRGERWGVFGANGQELEACPSSSSQSLIT